MKVELCMCSIRPYETYQIIDTIHLKIELITGNQAVLGEKKC